ncbi:uncharacterized protein LOC116346179 [Contarinia nasturtii]|uniref:uncharacterized protein LOC116346179 n=1 Tax=Contarinia nasturtii TaxID=265458 RepID=UPI0012D3B818|nr:uncharacterized protein LOC116346179 [Contarinia nasturtii]
MVGCYFYSGIASVRDPVAGTRYCAFASGPDVENCIVGYAELLRSRIENAYRDSIELITSRCNQDVMNRRRPTGYGYWSVNLIGMEGQTKRNSDISCDPDLFSKGPFTYCDLYSQIYINDNLVFTSSKGSNENEHYTNEKFMSSKIKDDSIIRFELWDADARDDDICLQVTKNLNEVKHFRGKIQEGNNFIVLSTFWRRSYVDDGQIS